MPTPGDIEIRRAHIARLRADQGTDDFRPVLRGTAIVFNTQSLDLGGFIEIIRPRAFDRTVSEKIDLRALVDHDTGKVLGRISAATMKMKVSADGVDVEISPPNTSVGRDIVESVRRRIKGHPAIAKLGFASRPEVLRDLVRRVARHMDGVLLVNGLQRPIIRPDGTPAFPGAHRRLAGISGDGTREASLATVRDALAIRNALGLDLEVWAVGGLSTPAEVAGALGMGADAALVATAAMFDPLLAVRTKAGMR